MNKYTFKSYNPIFVELFNQEKKRISSCFTLPILIEHVGSTAVRELGGKGIIDIAIGVEKGSMGESKKTLERLGYEFHSSFSTEDRFYFINYLKDPIENERRYHIHLTYPESKEWLELISFRDYLRAHPKERDEYASVKKQAAMIANQDGKEYRKIKEPIILKIISAIQVNMLEASIPK